MASSDEYSPLMQPFIALREFLALEAVAGLLLGVAAAAAVITANSPLSYMYDEFREFPLAWRMGELCIAKTLLVFINEGLMAVFCLLIGLELKREVVEGELSELSQIALPALAAVGGMSVPALIYASFNWNDPDRLHGWAIPAATDTAIALGVLERLGPRMPHALKVFLLTLAILDDFGAILIIAVFHSDHLSIRGLPIAASMLLLLWLMQFYEVQRVMPYMVVGFVLWGTVLESGVHATLAGLLLAMFIPSKPAHRLESDLHPLVAFLILPIFAFANAGVSLHGINASSFTTPVTFGIFLGLVVGKPVGIFSASALTICTGAASMPKGSNWGSLLGVSMLCGIGFTMSLCIAALAFEGQSSYAMQTRIGILAGSLVSALLGYSVLHCSLPAAPDPDPKFAAAEA